MHIKALVMLEIGERRQPSGDRVIRTWLDSDVVGRIGVDEIDRLTLHQAVHIFRAGRIPTQQPMVTENPQIATARDCLLERLGNGVFFRETFARFLRKQPFKFVLIKADHFQVENSISNTPFSDRQKKTQQSDFVSGRWWRCFSRIGDNVFLLLIRDRKSQTQPHRSHDPATVIIHKLAHGGSHNYVPDTESFWWSPVVTHGL